MVTVCDEGVNTTPVRDGLTVYVPSSRPENWKLPLLSVFTAATEVPFWESVTTLLLPRSDGEIEPLNM